MARCRVAVRLRTLLVAGTGMTLGACGDVDRMREHPAASATSPVLLLHGLGGSGEAWHEAGVVRFLRHKGLEYGGDVRFDSLRVPRVDGQMPGAADFYTVSITDPYGDLDDWSAELGAAIQVVRVVNEASHVAVLASSAGGLAARRYLVLSGPGHGIRQLATIGSPHLGTDIALLGRTVREVLRSPELSAPLRELAGRLEGLIERATGVALDAPIIDQMVPEEYGNDWLAALNAQQHPSDVEYVSIVAETEGGSRLAGRLGDEAVRLYRDPVNSTIWARVIQLVLEVMDQDGWSPNDGLVLVESQHVDAVVGVRESGAPHRAVRAIARTHQDAKRDLQALLSALASEPRISWAGVGPPDSTGQPTIVAAIDHSLPELLSLRARTFEGNDIPVRDPAVYRGSTSSEARVRIGPFPPSATGLTLEIESSGRSERWLQHIVSSDPGAAVPPRGGAPADDAPTGLAVTIERVQGVPLHRASGDSWDLSLELLGMDGTWPDVVVSVAVDQTRILDSSVHRDHQTSTIELGGTAYLDVDPSVSSVGIELWDDDRQIGDPDDLMGVIDWAPGTLPVGEITEIAAGGWSVTVRWEWGGVSDVVLASPVTLHGQRNP